MSFNEFRKSKRLTLEEIAKLLHVSISLVAKCCTGERGLSKAMLTRIKKAFPDTDMNIFFLNLNYTMRVVP